jgi:hypothetical protein
VDTPRKREDTPDRTEWAAASLEPDFWSQFWDATKVPDPTVSGARHELLERSFALAKWAPRNGDALRDIADRARADGLIDLAVRATSAMDTSKGWAFPLSVSNLLRDRQVWPLLPAETAAYWEMRLAAQIYAEDEASDALARLGMRRLARRITNRL